MYLFGYLCQVVFDFCSIFCLQHKVVDTLQFSLFFSIFVLLIKYRDMEEIWKSVKGYEGFYEVSSLGRVRSVDRVDLRGWRRKGKILKPCLGNCGYEIVNLCNTLKLVHRLVAEAFIPNPNNLPVVNHKNEVKVDNRMENLEWCTYQYNATYNDVHLKATRHRITIEQVSLNGETIARFSSLKEAERVTGIPNSHISDVINAKIVNSKSRPAIRRTAGGFIWRKVEC